MVLPRQLSPIQEEDEVPPRYTKHLGSRRFGTNRKGARAKDLYAQGTTPVQLSQDYFMELQAPQKKL